jgi:predicted dienelactone hydrolase
VSRFACAVGLLLTCLAAPTAGSAASSCRRAPARDTAFFAEPGTHAVGVRTLRLVDDTRPLSANNGFPGAPVRPLDTEVWYPAVGAAGAVAVRDAPVDRSAAPYPLILHGHALSDNRRGEVYLTEHLASHGFIVAAVDFPLGKIGAPGGTTPTDLANQPGDMRAVLDQLLAGAGGLADVIDTERIGASGLSLGAATVLLLTYHRDLRDDRIRAVLPLAPPFSCLFTRRFYRGVRVPLLLIHGDADALVELEENSGRVFARARGARTLVTVHGGSHLGFTNFATGLAPEEIDALGCTVLLAVIGSDPPLPALPGGPRAGISSDPDACALPCAGPIVGPVLDAERQHVLTRAVGAAFFASALNDDAGARCWLARGLARENSDVGVKSRRH